MYRIRSTCGAPAFKPEASTLTHLEFEFVEFNSVDTTSNAVWNNTVNRASYDMYKQNSPPSWGMPTRNHIFNNSVGGNMI